MGATYTRQSSYTDGDVITAAHTNDEFNQLLASFQASTGHTHDGTANEGGAITKLLGNSLTFGAATAGTDITVTFDGESNDGLLTWKEDEDYFEFNDDLLIASTEKLQFRDTGLYIYSSADGQLDIVADTEVQIAATTIDINGAVDVSGNLDVGGNLTVTGTTTFNGGTLTLGDAASDNVVFGADVNSSIIPNTDDTYDLGSTGQRWKDAYIDGVAYIDTINYNGTAITSTAEELNILDGVTASAADINLIDGITNGTVIASKAIITDSNKDITGGRNITITGELDAGSLDISGDADIAGTVTFGGVTLAETISDTVGAMVTSNTETGIAVTYDDADNTLDFVIGAGAIVNSMLADDAVGADELASNAVVTASIVDANVTTAKIAADAVTGAKIADNTIDSEHYAAGSIDLEHMAANSVDSDQYVDGSIDTIHISADAVTGAKIADNAIDSEHYTDGSIDTAHIADSQITVAKMAANSVDSDQYVDGSIDTAHIANLQITTGLIAADAITAAKIADDVINSEHYAAGSIDTEHIADSQITVAKMAANSIDSDQYVDGSIDTAHISADAITEAKIADNAVQSEHINDNVISGQTELASGIADADELLISDAGTIKRVDASVFKTYIGAADDATALAIALG